MADDAKVSLPLHRRGRCTAAAPTSSEPAFSPSVSCADRRGPTGIWFVAVGMAGAIFRGSQRRKQVVPRRSAAESVRIFSVRCPVCTRRAGAASSDCAAAQDDERFNLSGQEYLERYHIPVYVSDSIRAILDAREERPLETALKYFNSVLQVAAVSFPLCALTCCSRLCSPLCDGATEFWV